MIMNVPPAPEMQGTPMTPDLSKQMQPDMVDVSQAEIQEAQGALMQIVQVIKMLIEQGLNEDQIMQFLAQYGITEAELDQAVDELAYKIAAKSAAAVTLAKTQFRSMHHQSPQGDVVDYESDWMLVARVPKEQQSKM